MESPFRADFVHRAARELFYQFLFLWEDFGFRTAKVCKKLMQFKFFF